MLHSSGLLHRFETLVAAAVIAAHANADGDGRFRQRDVRFLLGLFSNWIEHCIGEATLSINNTQIQRYIESLVEDGLCTRTQRKRTPCYRLRRIGIIELLGRVTAITPGIQPELNLFMCYFIYNYRDRLWEAVEREGKKFPPALKIELEELLDYSALITQLIAQAEIELRKLKIRIHDAERSAILAESLHASGEPTASIAKKVEAQFPYELNSQKTLRELLRPLPETHADWELRIGAKRRVCDLWSPLARLLEAYLATLQSLQAENA